MLELLQDFAAGRGYDLGQAVVVAKVDKQHPAMIALAVDPARQADFLADVGGAKLGAMVGTVGVHVFHSLYACHPGLDPGSAFSSMPLEGGPRLKAGVTV
jgi:hypothetical protein